MNGQRDVTVMEREEKSALSEAPTVQLKDTLMEISYAYRNNDITEDNAVQMVSYFLEKAAKEIDSYYLGMAMAIFAQSGSDRGVQAIFDSTPGVITIETVSYARSLSGGEYAINPKIAMPSYA